MVWLLSGLVQYGLGDAAVRHLITLRDLWPHPQYGYINTQVCIALAEALLMEHRLDELEALTTELQARGDAQKLDLVRLTYVQAELSWWREQPQSALDLAKRGVKLMIANKWTDGRQWDELKDEDKMAYGNYDLFSLLRRLEADALEKLGSLEEAMRVDVALWEVFRSSLPRSVRAGARSVNVSPEATAREATAMARLEDDNLILLALSLTVEMRRLCVTYVTPARHVRKPRLQMERECRPLQMMIDLECTPYTEVAAPLLRAKMAMCGERGQDMDVIMREAQAAADTVVDERWTWGSGAKKAAGGSKKKKKKTRKDRGAQQQQETHRAQDTPSGPGATADPGGSSSAAGAHNKAAASGTEATQAVAAETRDAKGEGHGSARGGAEHTSRSQGVDTPKAAGAQAQSYEEDGDDDEERWCSICLVQVPEQPDGTVAGSRLACGHTFHEQCVDMWGRWCSNKAQELSCPTCRAPV